jgi:quinoprotein glucose dehydrogenase
MAYILGRARDPNAPPPPPGQAPAAAAAEGAGGGEGAAPGLTVQGLPLTKPPYGRITAIDLNKGEIAWQIAHGDTPDNVRNHPALKGLSIPRTGRANGRIGTLVTKTLLIAGEAGFVTTKLGRGAMLRAYDKATGQDVGAVYMPAPQTGSPMTYLLNGRQYLVVAISGAGYSGELVAYALP